MKKIIVQSVQHWEGEHFVARCYDDGEQLATQATGWTSHCAVRRILQMLDLQPYDIAEIIHSE